MSVNLAALLFLVSAVLFILALRGLSHPSTSRKGNLYGMVGMGIAIVTTLLLAKPDFPALILIVLALAIGLFLDHPYGLCAGRPRRRAGGGSRALFAGKLRYRHAG